MGMCGYEKFPFLQGAWISLLRTVKSSQILSLCMS